MIQQFPLILAFFLAPFFIEPSRARMELVGYAKVCRAFRGAVGREKRRFCLNDASAHVQRCNVYLRPCTHDGGLRRNVPEDRRGRGAVVGGGGGE